MSAITKGTLVMTEHGIRLYLYMDADTDFMVGRKDKFCEQLIGKGGNFCHTAIPLSSEHRAQVEAKIKEMGWKHQMAGIVELAVWGTYNKKGNLFTVEERDKKWHLCCHHLNSKDFDTAPAQLAEAILVAQLLNATKD